MKTLSFILIALLGLSCSQHSSKKSTQSHSSKSYLRILQKRKALIDRLPEKDTSAIAVFVKMSNEKELVRVFNGRFPDDSIEYSYSVLTNKGKVIMVMCSPFSESGDWDVECVHYFDTDGHTFGFEKTANAFRLPYSGAAYETTTDYFDPDFKRIKHIYTLVDIYKKPLDKQYAFDYQDMDCKEYATVAECLDAYHILLNK